MKRLLIIDDEEDLCITLKKIFSTHDWVSYYSLDGENLTTLLASLRPHCIILDIKLGTKHGLDLIPLIRDYDSQVPIVILTAFESVKSAVDAMKKGAFHYLAKPFDNEELVSVVNKACEQYKDLEAIEDHSSRIQDEFMAVLGTSADMVEVIKKLQIVSQTQVSVLLSGESGVGKEVCARLIHKFSPRANQPYVVLDANTITPSIIESELFGFEKGAFTGATVSKKGRLESAHNGTLFLDEIGNFPLEVQTKLLRFLETREIESLGGGEKKQISVRIIAATHVDLPSAINRGQFRNDLFFRLNQFPILIPPLRKRMTDLPFLCKNILNQLNIELEKNITHITTKALQALLCYTFPGNIRELRNILTQAMLATHDTVIDGEHLPQEVSKVVSLKEASKMVSTQLEKTLIMNALDQSKGHQGNAAVLLGVTPRTLYNKMKEFGLV